MDPVRSGDWDCVCHSPAIRLWAKTKGWDPGSKGSGVSVVFTSDDALEEAPTVVRDLKHPNPHDQSGSGGTQQSL